jgi:sulfite reductase (NADPH) hemoprotein beta-component
MFTATQNVIISDVAEKDKAAIEEVLRKFKIIEHTESASLLRKNAIACVALPTCPLALAEGQRYLPELISKMEPLLEKHKIADQELIVRMTGCPNGCGRSAASEIGFIGTHPGRYNLHIGGDNEGLRLNTKYKESLNEAELLTEMDSLFGLYNKERNKGETFGDFTIRKQLVK